MIEPIQHGGGLDRAMARYGGGRADWLDLSTGINPRPYPVPVLDGDVWGRLPDESLMAAAIAAARQYYGVGDHVALLPVAGAQAAIQCLPALLPGGGVHIIEPCYGEYAHVLDPQRFAPREAAQTVILANPNNPDGQHYDRPFVEDLLAAGKTVIIDEAFCDVSPDQSLIGLADRANLLMMKSFGKFFGLAGVRLGFVIGDAVMVSKVKQQLGPWAVSGPALAIGAQALADEPWISTSRQWLATQREALQAMLESLGFQTVGATDLFVTVAHPRAGQIADALAQSQILVRPFDYASDWLRFGLPKDEGAMKRLRQVLASVL